MDVRHKRGTRAALVALALSGGLIADQIYLLSDEGNRPCVATSVNTFTELLKQGEGGGSLITISASVIDNELIVTHPLNSSYAITNGELVRTGNLPSLIDGELHIFI